MANKKPTESKGQKKNILLIVESPSKVKTISKYLPDDNFYKVLPTKGHVTELAKTGKNNLGINVDKNYEPSFILMPDRIDIMKAIFDNAKKADKILIATDPDREGEHIGASVLKRIPTDGKEVKRIKLHKITEKGILEALDNEEDVDENLVEAAVARRVLDRVVGFLASPLVISRLGKGLSAGRVQSVALRLVVDREREIEQFKPEEYWNINVSLLKFASDIPILSKLHQKTPVSDSSTANAIKKELEKSTFSVKKIEAKEKKKSPPKPLITSEMLKVASSRYSFSAQRGMKAAQTLYESGKITYLRTDSIRQSDEAIQAARKWISENYPSCLPKDKIIYRNADAAQDAHEAIRPTSLDSRPLDKPISDEDKLYKIIWEITIASQMTPALFDTTSVTIITDKKRELKATGSVLKDPGFLNVTRFFNLEQEDSNDTKLPILVEGDALNINNPPGVTAEQKFTQPPSRYSEGAIIDELKKRGIGRPSTYAEIISKISNREYVSTKGKSLVATETGKKLVDFLTKYFDFMDYSYTASMETMLDTIANGNHTYKKMMKDFFEPFNTKVKSAYVDSKPPINFDTEANNCEKCGNEMVLKKNSAGQFFFGCSKYPDCKHTAQAKLINGKYTVFYDGSKDAPEHIKCKKCEGPMRVVNGKYGVFYGCKGYPKCDGIQPFEQPEEQKNCPKCDSKLIKKFFTKPPYIGNVLCCSKYPNCRYIEKLYDKKAKKDEENK